MSKQCMSVNNHACPSKFNLFLPIIHITWSSTLILSAASEKKIIYLIIWINYSKCAFINKSQTKTVTFYKPNSAHLRLKNEKPVSADYAIISGKSGPLISCTLKLKENT